MSKRPLSVSCERGTSMTFIQAYLTFCCNAARQHLICTACKKSAARLMHGVVHFRLAYHILFICLCVSACVPLIVNRMKRLKYEYCEPRVIFFLCVHVHVCTCDCMCETVCVRSSSICSVSTALSRRSAELSRSPGCNSN